jgi:protocatechuate 3,4-dioxygenase beta subunit
LAPITDDEAMRINGTNYERFVNITVDPATFEGYVYQNKDEDEAYNVSSDDPLPDVEITLMEIDETDPETGLPLGYGAFNELTTDENGYYNISDLMPGIYLVRAVLDDFVIHENYAFIFSGNNSYNISKPKSAAVEGTVYFDDNENDKYDNGEEMNNVNVELLYTKLDGENKLVKSTTTDETGIYSFSSLDPGRYIINATKRNTETGYLDYSTEETVTLMENETTTFNVSITYATIVLSGHTKHGTENIGDTTIDFSPDESIENNTAERARVTSEEDGSYEAKLKPGHYNISIDDTSGEHNAAYSYSGQITLAMGEGVKSFNILMTKETVTVSGGTTYNGANIDNITITFSPDIEVENNTAERTITISDEDGSYVAELMPGTYIVQVDEIVNETGQDVTYTFTGQLEVKDTDVAISFDIALTRDEQD